MKQGQKNKGFSLTEVLMASGILAVGMMMIAGVFPVAIHLTTVAAERTMAAVIADQAFAKIKLYGVNLGALGSNCADFNDVAVTQPATNEYAYPAMDAGNSSTYYWWAICRKVNTGSDLVQVTVFISRKTGANLTYLGQPIITGGNFPIPVAIGVTQVTPNRLKITNPAEKTYINTESTIVDNQTGDIYRVLERDSDPALDDQVDLEINWQGGNSVWVVPPPVNGGKNPCVGIYQRVIRF